MANGKDDQLFSKSEVKEALSPWVRNTLAIIVGVAMTANSLGFNSQQINAAYSTSIVRQIENKYKQTLPVADQSAELVEIIKELKLTVEELQLEVIELKSMAHPKG